METGWSLFHILTTFTLAVFLRFLLEIFAGGAVEHQNQDTFAGYALFRTRVRAAIPVEERENFTSTPSARAATPESINLDPRATPDA